MSVDKSDEETPSAANGAPRRAGTAVVGLVAVLSGMGGVWIRLFPESWRSSLAAGCARPRGLEHAGLPPPERSPYLAHQAQDLSSHLAYLEI